jgi:MFS family permease
MTVWPRIWLLYAAGLLAAAQLGKMSALAPLFAPALGLGLAAAAWAVSLIEVGGATCGAAAGALTQRLGLWRTLRWGLAALALAGLGSASAGSGAALMAWRVLEAAGYLGVVVTAPVLMARLSLQAGPHGQMLAMSLWATFVPLGAALGAAGAAAAVAASATAWPGGPAPWRLALAAGGLVAVALAAYTWQRGSGPEAEPALTSATPSPSHPRGGAGPAAWCLALAFGLFALCAVAVIGLLPTLLVQGAGMSAAAAGTWTGGASAAAVLGSAAGALWMRHALPPRGLALASLALPALAVWGVYAAAPRAALAVGLAIAINVLGGVFASLAFAALPRVARQPGQLARANGLIAQFGASGSLLGPPLAAAGIAQAGWPGAAAVVALASLLALPLAWRALSPQALAGGEATQGKRTPT